MKYYDEIKEKLIDNEIYFKVKDYSKENYKLKTYYEVGKLLSESGKHYGENIIGEFSKRLSSEIDKKYNTTNLKRMRQLFRLVEKGALLGHHLSWSHYKELIPLKDINKINYYVTICDKNNITRDVLKCKIKLKEYERLPEKTKLKIINREEKNIIDLVPNPIIIRNMNGYLIINEKVLKRILLEDIESL